ncbi:hypothetical protein [Jannaschia sp. M317]|uniref:hypothetical protein n=1 Tax=Jannaschia sp. M317 TaxID=2867011 RepID=UPI0021A836A8|nr:hypothetical protein [Jannaschia sp. M317]UWQ16941.1 hypothetical protein K3551_13715 [Jannaschia sp. M317]
MNDQLRPQTPHATLCLLSEVQRKIDCLTQEAVALRAHLLSLPEGPKTGSTPDVRGPI